jgi:hypothetical protein
MHSDRTDPDATSLDFAGRLQRHAEIVDEVQLGGNTATDPYPDVLRPPAFQCAPKLTERDWRMLGVLAATVAEDARENGNEALAKAYEALARKCDQGVDSSARKS